MTLLELADHLLLDVESSLGLRQLNLEELGGPHRLSLAGLEVLLDVERRQGVGDSRHRLGVTALVTQIEGDRRATAIFALLHSFQLQPDVLAQAPDQLFGRNAIALLGLKV